MGSKRLATADGRGHLSVCHFAVKSSHAATISTTDILAQRIERAILQLRGERVMLDSDLADLYGVETRALVQAVKRNCDRFLTDFAFQLSAQEFTNLKSQSVTSSLSGVGHGGRRKRPWVFTEQASQCFPAC